MRIVTLLTDFGTSDAFVGIMKGVILQRAPAARIVDLSHGLAQGDRLAAAFQLRGALPYFPAQTIHVVVVDPGVGSARRILAARAGGGVVIAPDNGLLTPLRDRLGEVRAVENQDWIAAEVSRTFHGRDVFAPVAARLAAGESFDAVGPVVEPYLDVSLWPAPVQSDEILTGAVVHVDHFGNLISNLPAELLDTTRPVTIELDGKAVGSLETHYAAVETGEPVGVIDSFGLLEIAVRDGDASQRFGAARGATVSVRAMTR